MSKNNGLALAAAFVGGAIAGAACGLLLAPEKGEDSRRKIKEALEKNGIKPTKELVAKLYDDLKEKFAAKEAVPAEDFDAE